MTAQEERAAQLVAGLGWEYDGFEREIAETTDRIVLAKLIEFLEPDTGNPIYEGRSRAARKVIGQRLIELAGAPCAT